MLIALVERYLSLRQTLGFTLRNASRNLRAFAQFAADRGNTHIHAATAMAWASEAPSPSARHVRLCDIVHLARFLHAEDPASTLIGNDPPSAKKMDPPPVAEWSALTVSFFFEALHQPVLRCIISAPSSNGGDGDVGARQRCRCRDLVAALDS